MKLANVINKDVFEVRHGVQLTPTGMNLPETLNEAQWNEIGDQVIRLGNASNWIIGDWWAFGDHQYGSRKKWLAEQKARRVQLKSFQTLRIIANVCRAFERFRRRNVVSFEMHRELIGLKEPEQDRFLDLLEAGEIKTHKELRAKILPAKIKRAKPKALVLRMFLGVCNIENPLPTWRVCEDLNLENHQTIACTKCWTHTTGGEILTTKGPRVGIFGCHCPESERNATINPYPKE